MAEQIETGVAPAPTEAVHMPEPSYLPVLVALGITLALLGLLLVWPLSLIGIAIFLVATLRWIRETRADIADLPLEH